MIPFEIMARNGDLLLSDWPLDAKERRSLKVMLHTLFKTDFALANGSVIFKVGGVSGIYYSKIRGHTQLRPRCCLGPDRPRDEVTYLFRAREKDDTVLPRNADEQASRVAKELKAELLERTRYQPMPEEDFLV